MDTESQLPMLPPDRLARNASKITSWLDSVQPSSPQDHRSSPLALSPPAKRARRHYREGDADADDTPQFATPPLSDNTMEPNPDDPFTTPRAPKLGLSRKRHNDDVDQLAGEMGVACDITPKAKARLPSPKKQKRRDPSPKKSRAVLDSLRKPFRIYAIPNYGDAIQKLPADVKPLYQQIFAQTDKRGVIPHEVREEMSQYIPDDPRYFRDPDSEDGASDRAKAVFTTLCSINRKATDSQTYRRDESAWNHLIHTPILELVFNTNIPRDDDIPEACARFEPATSVSMAGHAIPYLKNIGGDSVSLACSVTEDSELVPSSISSYDSDLSLSLMRSRGVKIDYVLVLDVPPSVPLSKTISMFSKGDFLPHMNQTAYLPIRDSPIAVSIETKTETGASDPAIQLGIWTVAWYEHMYDLRSRLLGVGPKPRLVSTLIIQVVGHNWQIYFACDRGSSVDAYGPVSIGSTDSLMSLYVLLGSLQAIKSWVEETFYTGIQSWFTGWES